MCLLRKPREEVRKGRELPVISMSEFQQQPSKIEKLVENIAEKILICEVSDDVACTHFNQPSITL